MEWSDPPWKRQGRTGPGPFAPRYAKSRDRRQAGGGCAVAALVGLGAAFGLSALGFRLLAAIVS